jgi:hypothetical protein
LGWLGLGGHRAGPNLDLSGIYEQFKMHYGVTFTYERFVAIRPLLLEVLKPGNAQRPQAPLHLLVDLIEARQA